MAEWDLTAVRQKTRQLSGHLSEAELSNDDIDNYINRYLQFEFPAEVKLNRNYSFYEVNTTANTQSIDFSSAYTNFVPEATIDRKEINFYQNPDKFYAQNPEQVSRFSTWTGDGATAVFANTYSNNTPIKSGSVYVDDTVEVFTDDGLGVLTGDQGGTGTVNYTTGAISVTFNTAPTSGQTIQSSFITMTTGEPTAVLMWDNQFTFYPVPDKAYRFRVKAWSLNIVKPATGSNKQTMTLATDKPLLEEWGLAWSFGASRRIVEDFGETDRYAELTMLYKEQIQYILARTCIDLESTRALPMW